MAIYFREDPPKAYINVGGGRAAAGPRAFKALLKPGLLASELPANVRGDSLIARFLRERIPVIQLNNVKQLARRYGLPIAPSPCRRRGGAHILRDALQQVAGRRRPSRDRPRAVCLLPLRLGVPHPPDIVEAGGDRAAGADGVGFRKRRRSFRLWPRSPSGVFLSGRGRSSGPP